MAVNALVRPALSPPLDAAEAQALTRVTLAPLFHAWGGAERLRRPYAADVELLRLALGVADVAVVESCAADALVALDARSDYRQAAAWGQQAIALLAAGRTMPPLPLLWRAGEACVQVGEPEPARGYYDQALARIAAGEAATTFERGGLLLAQGRLLAESGEPDRALDLFEQAHGLAAEQDNPKNAAVILGEIARLRADKGEVDQALQLHEEALRVYEALGDRRSRAITLGDIARLRANKGEVDQALQLHEEELRVFEALGDRRSHAITLGDIARLRANKGEVDQALQLHEERQRVYEALGDRRSRAVTLGDIARLRANKGEVDQALQLHEEALRVYEALGDRRSRAVALGDIARLRANKGEVDQALQLHEEACASTRRWATAARTPSRSATSPGCAPARARSTRHSSCNRSGWRRCANSVTLTVRRLRCGTSRSSNCSGAMTPMLRRASSRPTASSTGSVGWKASASSAYGTARSWRRTDNAARRCRSCAGPKPAFGRCSVTPKPTR